MALVDELLKQVSDPALRDALVKEVDTLRTRMSFGLVFERHIPEIAVVPGGAIRVGSIVRRRDRPQDDTDLVVEAVSSRSADVRPASGDGTTEKVTLKLLASVKPFGEPVYPGLRSLERLERGGDRPYHAVINGENFHVLQLLASFGDGTVDCIYIDPPYNTGARDWKYNNHYVDANDRYRHSKWLSMMEKRLLIARRLLKRDGVLVVTIDEKEYLRLGLLLEQVFRGRRIQMVSSLINPALQSRPGGFGRSDEYIFFVMQGDAAPKRTLVPRDWVSERGRTFTGTARWDLLRRSGTSATRSDSPGGFYPIYVEPDGPKFREIGDALEQGVSEPTRISGAVPVLPIRKDGSEGRWQVSPANLRQYLAQGRVRIGGSEESGFVIYYLKGGEYDKVLNGEYPVTGRNADGSLRIGEGAGEDGEVVAVPSTQWRIPSHDATQYGSRLLKRFLPRAEFPFPKSLYAVRDTLRFFLEDKPEAVVLDFFGGSGTTLHATLLMNAADNGRRRCILVTNNEVGADTTTALNSEGLFSGDATFEAEGIFERVARPRCRAAITGTTPDGDRVEGEYLNGRPYGEGFNENVEFFDLSYLDFDDVELGRCFTAIDPILWLTGSARGSRKKHEVEGDGFFIDEDAGYAVLADDSKMLAFEAELARRAEPLRIFHITNAPEAFSELTALVGSERARMLYRDFIAACRMNVAASA